jgi:hypothetical protein
MAASVSILHMERLDHPAARSRLWFLGAIGLALLGLLCSCTTSNYGRLQSSHEITQLFENAQVLQDHSYYFSGLQGVPDAIIAIHPNYALRDKLWTPVDFTHAALEKWVYRMSYVQLTNPHGAWILGPKGDRLGIWFAAQRGTSVRLDRENRVVVSPPKPPDLRGIP